MSKTRSIKKISQPANNNYLPLNPPLVNVASLATLEEPVTIETPLQAIPELESVGVLIADRGTQLITREQLALISTPPVTRTYKPVSHIQLVQALTETLSFRKISVVNDEYAITKDGRKMFGLLELSEEFTGCRFALGIRNAHNRTMCLAMTVGLKVLVCSNMAFQGDFIPIRIKHSNKLELFECASIAVDRMQRNFQPLKTQVERWKEDFISNEEARLIIYDAFIGKKLPLPMSLMPQVHSNYFKPEISDFKEPNLWCLSNAFTSAFKELSPVRKFELTGKLAEYLTRFTAPF